MTRCSGALQPSLPYFYRRLKDEGCSASLTGPFRREVGTHRGRRGDRRNTASCEDQPLASVGHHDRDWLGLRHGLSPSRCVPLYETSVSGDRRLPTFGFEL